MAFNHVLVATDFSECSDAALKYGVEIAVGSASTLTVVHAFELPYTYVSPFLSGEILSEARAAAERQLETVLEPIRRRIPAVTGVVRLGSPWEQILEAARELGADLIVVGSHGRAGVPRALLGSIAEKVVRVSAVPVLTVHGPPPT